MRNLGLPGEECAERIQDGISEILKGDASDAAARLGPESCQLYEDLLWARHVAKALAGDLPESVRLANRLLAEIPKLPDVGPLADLRCKSETVREAVAAILAREDFYAHSADLQTRRSELDRLVETTATALANEYEAFLETEKQLLESRSEWQAIGGEDQDRLASRLDSLRIEIESTRLLHKSWHVIVTRTPTFRVANASQNSPMLNTPLPRLSTDSIGGLS